MAKLSSGVFFLIMVVAIAVQSNGTVAADEIGAAPRDASGRFTNGSANLAHGSIGVRAGFMLRRFATYFRGSEGAPERIANDGTKWRVDAGATDPSVTWIGHSTLLV